MYYISKAPNGSAMISNMPPKGKHYIEMDKLTEGDGMLMFDGKRVYRVPRPAPVPDPLSVLAEKVAANGEAQTALEDAMCEMDAVNQDEIAELQETTSALEEAMCEMDAANEERMAAIEEALCEMDMG